MATKTYDHALNFMPAKAVQTTKTGRGPLGWLKTLISAFTDARLASARYDSLVSRGVPAGKAARMAFSTVYEKN